MTLTIVANECWIQLTSLALFPKNNEKHIVQKFKHILCLSLLSEASLILAILVNGSSRNTTLTHDVPFTRMISTRLLSKSSRRRRSASSSSSQPFAPSTKLRHEISKLIGVLFVRAMKRSESWNRIFRSLLASSFKESTSTCCKDQGATLAVTTICPQIV